MVPVVHNLLRHRCIPGVRSVEALTQLTHDEWNRKSLFHYSSPSDAWISDILDNYHTYIAVNLITSCLTNLNITVEVKAKENKLAVSKFNLILSYRAEKLY